MDNITSPDAPSTCSEKPDRESPTKQLCRKVAMYRKRVSRLRKKLQITKAQIARLSGKSNDIKRANNILAQHLVGNAYNMMVTQLTMSAKCNKKRWSKDVKLYCLSLYYKTPSAYRFLQKTSLAICQNSAKNIPKF